MKKRVLFLVNHDIVIYNFRREIVERLLKEGYNVIISSPYGERIDDLVKLGCDYVEVKFDRHGINLFSELRLLMYYKKMINKLKPDIILGFTIKPNIYGALAAQFNKVPFVANITGLGTAVEKKGMLQKISVFLYKIAFRNIQTVFFQNNENRTFFVTKKIALEKHKMLPGSGVNLNYFTSLVYPPEETTQFVYISRIMREKGIDQYLEAAKIITRKYTNVKFHVCGFCEEDYEEKLSIYQDKGIITYHGMVKDIREVLKYTHCTIHPTYYPEGLSNVLLESAASNRPLITTDRSGTREVVEDGVSGYLIKVQDVEDLVLKIELFLDLSYENKIKMGDAGRCKVEREFDRNIVVENYLKEVEFACNQPSIMN